MLYEHEINDLEIVLFCFGEIILHSIHDLFYLNIYLSNY